MVTFRQAVRLAREAHNVVRVVRRVGRLLGDVAELASAPAPPVKRTRPRKKQDTGPREPDAIYDANGRLIGGKHYDGSG